ncbi:DUF761-associated sequence motif [Carex littledalei]|uniref:DUF761-associated sequence motif n=1 Tax=Carex littledalei TaxID=544730 RepID=A0A833QMH6_9POAL|nr:DUF761-associated sequence motif [Carex littledalei]
MARRPDLNSDFAQKLLGDIRTRKERLGYASSGQRSSNTSPSFNAEANSRRSFRSAQGTTKNNFHPQSSNNKGLPSPQRKTKQPTLNASSQEIVPYRKERTPSMANADVSMALALALSNTGKLQNIEVLSRTKVGTEFVTHRGSIHFSSPNSPFLSNGRASNRNEFLLLPNSGFKKKLSEMISAYSNGRKHKTSLAMELEESLNMLIMLQDASDYMGASNKNQVLLLKDKEENENDIRRKSPKRSKLNSDKKSLNSFQRSVNSGTKVTTKRENDLLANTSNSNFMNSNYSNSSRGNSEYSKLRIPNVIARLMGLEDLPEPVKPKVEIKEVETQGKEEKSEDNIKRSIKKENDMSAKCRVEVREETRLERITRTYIDSKKGLFGKCAINAHIPPKRNDEKVHTVRNQKKREKPNHEVVKQKTVIAPEKVVQKVQCLDKHLMKKQSISNSLPGKVVVSNSIKKKKDVDGNMWQAKNKKVLEKGCKIGEKHVQKNKILMELGKEKGRETEVIIADLDKNDVKKDDINSSKVILDQSSNEEKNHEISGTNLDAHQEPQTSVSGQEQLQVPEEEQTDSCNCTKGSTNVYHEDSLTEDQILLREMFLSDSEFLDLSQALFAIKVTTVEIEKMTKTPLEKGNNMALVHTAHEILKRKATRLDICENIKIQGLNSLIRELDSDIRSLEYGKKSEKFDLQRIIEREIRGGHPDANCMWEFGWNRKQTAPFEKCEIAKELEKHLTSGLITELTRDLVDEIILV